MGSPYKNQEHNGWCGRCRTLWCWVGAAPAQQDAHCPTDACALPLARKPRGNIGRYRIENCVVREHDGKPTLVLITSAESIAS